MPITSFWWSKLAWSARGIIWTDAEIDSPWCMMFEERNEPCTYITRMETSLHHIFHIYIFMHEAMPTMHVYIVPLYDPMSFHPRSQIPGLILVISHLIFSVNHGWTTTTLLKVNLDRAYGAGATRWTVLNQTRSRNYAIIWYMVVSPAYPFMWEEILSLNFGSIMIAMQLAW